MFPLQGNNGAICYTGKMCSILMLKFNQLHPTERQSAFQTVISGLLLIHGIFLNVPCKDITKSALGKAM